MKLAGVLLCLLPTGTAFSQQIGIVDLTREESLESSQQKEETPLPPGCTGPTGIIADGERIPDDNQPRPVRLEIVRLSSEEIDVGSEVQAEVRLRNVGDKPIQIPWTTDSSTIEKAPDPDHLDWQEGRFRVVLRDKQNNTILLKSPDVWLYGTTFDNGSMVTISAGEWITALVNFRMEDEFHFRTNQIPLGKSELFLQWEQAVRKWDRAKCGWNRAWFAYRGYYKQEHPTVTVQVNRSGSGKSNEIH